MDEIQLIEIKEEILSDNRTIAEGLRRDLRVKKTLMINLMSSPGAGKTSLILKTAESLKRREAIGTTYLPTHSIEPGTIIEIDCRGKMVEAAVTAMPFYKGGSVKKG